MYEQWLRPLTTGHGSTRGPRRAPQHSAVFLDRDGVLNVRRNDYVKSRAEFAWRDGALAFSRELRERGWPVVIVTNQSAIGRGLTTREAVEEVHRYVFESVRQAGGALEGIYVCPHTPWDGCFCRKPRPGLLFQAGDDLGLDLRASYLLGDSVTDMEAARAAGCRGVLLQDGRGDPDIAGLAEGEVPGPVVYSFEAFLDHIGDAGASGSSGQSSR
jgi:D-glycero-D-manno-heptose 1,7-bisphosphate phosphatase